MVASYNNKKEVCKLLIERGAEVNHKNKQGETSLDHGVKENNTEVCILLLKNGAISEIDAINIVV